jgi:TRAP-type C4-dicarboxylate transport system permease small subunit
MNPIKYIFDRIFALLTWVACAILIAQTLLTFSNVFCRYLLNFSIYWADEVSLVLLIWFTFIALAIGVRKKVHVAIEFILDFLPAKFLDKVVARFVAALTFGLGIIFVYFGIKLTIEGTFSTLPATEWSSAVDYIFIPVSGFLVMYAAAEEFFKANKGKDYLDAVFMGKEGKK